MIGHALAIMRRLAWTTVAEGRVARADLARKLGRFRDAGLLYEEALRLVPERSAIRIQCAHMFKEAGDLASAGMHYQAAAGASTQDADFHLQWGHFFKVAGDLGRAAECYRRALALSPHWSEPIHELEELGRGPNRGASS